GVYSYDAITIENSTIADNVATYGAGVAYNAIGVGVHMGPSVLTAYSTLISGNTAFGQGAYDLAGETGATVVGTNNLIALSGLGVPGDTIRTPAILAAVADNGGLSPTQALRAGSPGIDAGTQPPSGPLANDQRGFGRWFGTGPDIGAFENQADRLLTTGFDFGPIAAPQGTFPQEENFDELSAFVPALPAGWSNVHTGTGGGWSTIESNVHTRPVSAFADDVNDISDSSLVTPAFTVGPDDELGFVHRFKLETDTDVIGYDGVVLEISIDGHAFTDLVTAGGTFLGGGYNRTLSDCCDNPLAGRQAWSDDSDGYHEVVATFPPSAVGHSVRLRWRMATDSSDRVQGYWLDDVRVGIGPA
ncbi:MAG TPA: choice-of-anchor Q domain-containing protein, partial [Rhodanobacteraceae bacterium]|nr:choice-of-anchor Q domain-containing protein [Rhodanobacteraceae bacterium]